MTEQQIRKVALFFFYAIGDNPLSMEFTESCLLKIQKQAKKNKDFEFDIVFVAESFFLWKKFKNNREGIFKKAVAKYQINPEKLEDAAVVKAEQLDLSAWHDFVNSCKEDEYIYLIWSKILKISDNHIAKAAGITEGTLRYRVGKALQRLGKTLIPGTKSSGALHGSP